VIAGRAVAVSLAVAAVAGAVLSGCSSEPQRAGAPSSTPVLPNAAPAPSQAPGAAQAADAVPRVEPRSRYGNPPFYEVFGKRYYVLSSSSAYVERGVASWYGPGFHKIRTSTGEPYDMYGMTAAHKTLPLPAYVRVTNLQNGRSAVVRVNDRGPFVGNRIIDLSYTAAAKLDMLRNGTAMVEVRAIDPSLPPNATTTIAPAVPPLDTSLFVQAGAFADPANAQRLAARLQGGGYGKVFVRDDLIAGRKMYRVRIGPVPGVPEFDRIVAALEQAGVRDAHLALD
jgi:peptidoglycan lytic transglycosylase